MLKDFRKWHYKKVRIDSVPNRPYFHEREIWFCHLGVNVGSEQDGTGDDFLRPVVVLRKFNNEIFWGLPLTRKKKKKKSPYYFSFSFSAKESVAILSQVRLIDARRLSHKIGEMREEDFSTLKERLKALLP